MIRSPPARFRRGARAPSRPPPPPPSSQQFNGESLVASFNRTHVNAKYLPGHVLPDNVVAVPSLEAAVAGATLLVFVLPHQFLPRLLPQIVAGLAASGTPLTSVRAISLIKGIDVGARGLVLISDTIRAGLGGGVETAVLMGANVADEVAAGQFCEATVGAPSAASGALWRLAFDAPTFRVAVCDDATTVELCGALKNVVAVGAGLVDGLGLGTNTKSAVMRLGLLEMAAFTRRFYAPGARDATFFESCGVADLITTCFGGRNRKCAEAFARAPRGERSWDAIEAALLGGQKLQGTLTALEVAKVLKLEGAEADFPLFTKIAKIVAGEAEPAALVEW